MTTRKNLIDKIKYGFLSVFLLISVLGQAQKCIDFENQTTPGNWKGNTGFGINSLSVINSPGTNSTKHLFFKDSSGSSVAINDKDFAGNWLTKGKDPCLCFDYRVNWNSNDPTTKRGPNFAIYKSTTPLNSVADYKNFVVNGNNSGLVAFFVPNSANPIIPKDIWNKYCLPLGESNITQLPSNNYGLWSIRQSDGLGNITILSGATAIVAWNTLIVNVEGVILSADYHSNPNEEISFDNFCWACVDEPNPTPCCDIDGFEATLTENNGSFSVSINGGNVSIQEVEISMIDYHIEYSNEDCKPDDMGNFGILSTTTTNLAGLLLNASDNNTSSLSWLLGSPAILNNSVNLDIIDPLTLNLDCCDVKISFCLKVRVKDVDCNECEKIICYTSEPQIKPCDLKITDSAISKSFCPGDTVTINWSGTSPSGLVNLSLIDVTNWVVYQIIATNIPNSGSYTYTIPTGIPCEPARSWQFYIEDPQKTCWNYGPVFTIECCEQTECDCGKWENNSIIIKRKLKQIPYDPKIKTAIKPYLGEKVTCGSKIKLRSSIHYSFTAPNYICTSANCRVSYKWEVIDSANNIIQSGTGKTFNYSFVKGGGLYKVFFTPICGSKECRPCFISIAVE